MKKARSTVKKATFQSYIADNKALRSNSSHVKGNNDWEEEEEGADEGPPQPRLLPGELTVSQAEQVLRYTPYGDHKQGISGTLFCTNFKVTFITPNRPVDKALTQRNRLVGENDIVLNNVDTVYQVSHGRRKKLFPSSGILGHVKNLEIHCKDFRVHSFSFKFTPKNEAKQVVNAIVHHAFPTRLELLFAFDYSGHTESTELEPCVPRYKLVEEWEAEVDRLHATEYKTTLCNKAFRIASSLPECIVVPKSLDNAVIGEAAPQFVDYRIPVWSYTHPSSGASLVRMAETIPEPAHKDIEDKMLKAIKLSNISLKLPEVHDLGKLPVTLSDIQTSNEKLRELCMPSSRKEMQALDSNWFSRLEDTRWMSIVAICLGKALEVVKDLIDKKLTVVIKEESCCDLAPVISCLVQLLVDPACRSLHGFQALVEREWVALGHRFADRCGFVASPDTEQCPVFLLFLDCCWQLLQQFPAAFQFSETYLTVLWDTVCLGLFENFIFNCARQRIVSANKFSMYPGTNPAAKLMSAWDWSKQFSEEELTLFNNPLYITRVQLKGFMSKVTPDGNKNLYHMNLGNHCDGSEMTQDSDGVLRPAVSLSCLKFWSYCYLRWLTPVEIIGGGTPSVYIQQCFLVEEIICLQHKIDSLEKSKLYVKSRRPKSDLFFSFECNASVNARKWSKVMTSSFPFVPDVQRSSGSPLSLYVETSYLCESDDSLDELSEHEVSPKPDRNQNHADRLTPSEERRHLANDVRRKDTEDNLPKSDVASPCKSQVSSSVSPRHKPNPHLRGSMLPRNSPYKVIDGHIVYADASPPRAGAHTNSSMGKSLVNQPRTCLPPSQAPLGYASPQSGKERSVSSDHGCRKKSVDNLFSVLGWQESVSTTGVNQD